VQRFAVRTMTWKPVLVALVAALALGMVLGNHVSYGTKRLKVKTGEAFLHNTDNWLSSFDTGDPDDQLTFYANAVDWSSSRFSGGSGRPPCLVEGRAVAVRVGYTRVAYEGGGAREIIAWVECLGAEVPVVE